MDRSRIELAKSLKRHGYSEREVADRVGVPVSTLRVELHRDRADVSNRIDVSFAKGSGVKTFYYCEDLEDAKKRFQWRYGYWPEDDHIIGQNPSKGPEEEGG